MTLNSKPYRKFCSKTFQKVKSVFLKTTTTKSANDEIPRRKTFLVMNYIAFHNQKSSKGKKECFFKKLVFFDQLLFVEINKLQ